MRSLESTKAVEGQIVVSSTGYPTFAKILYHVFRIWRHRTRDWLGHGRVTIGFSGKRISVRIWSFEKKLRLDNKKLLCCLVRSGVELNYVMRIGTKCGRRLTIVNIPAPSPVLKCEVQQLGSAATRTNYTSRLQFRRMRRYTTPLTAHRRATAVDLAEESNDQAEETTLSTRTNCDETNCMLRQNYFYTPCT